MRLVLEGLTGTGKTSTLAAMRRRGLLPSVVVSEEETFGDAMLEAAAPHADAAHVLRRLMAVCERLEGMRPDAFVLERAHLSYVAVGLPWEACDGVDARLAALGACVVVLVVPVERLRERSLLRREHGHTDWQRLTQHFGSEDAALAALATSQQRRLDARSRSRLPHRIVDTSDEDWDRVADATAAFVTRPSKHA